MPIVCVEDNEDEVFLLRHAFQQAQIPNPLEVVTNGPDAMSYLAGVDRRLDGEAKPFPCLVLLDLLLPGMSGLEIPEWIRAQPALASLVVII